jgi:hypothetical protein
MNYKNEPFEIIGEMDRCEDKLLTVSTFDDHVEVSPLYSEFLQRAKKILKPVLICTTLGTLMFNDLHYKELPIGNFEPENNHILEEIRDQNTAQFCSPVVGATVCNFTFNSNFQTETYNLDKWNFYGGSYQHNTLYYDEMYRFDFPKITFQNFKSNYIFDK